MAIHGSQPIGNNLAGASPTARKPNGPPPAQEPVESFTTSQTEWTPQAKPTNYTEKVEAAATRSVGQARSLFAALTVAVSAAVTGCATAGPAAHGPVSDNLQQTHISLEPAHKAGRQIHDTFKPVVQNTMKAAQPYIQQGKEAGKEIGKQAVDLTHKTGAFFKGLLGN